MQSLKKRASTNGYGKAVQVTIGNGSLRTLRVHNASEATFHVQVFDTASVPSDGATPTLPPIPIPAGVYYESDTPFDFRTGLYLCASSIAATKTLLAADHAWITTEYHGQ